MTRSRIALGVGVVTLACAGLAPAPAPRAVLDGLCEASAVVPWEGGWLVGDNETEGFLHRFDRDLRPQGRFELGAEVEDIEAVVVLPDAGLLVVGSQGANKDGKRKPLRERVLVVGSPPVVPDLSACAPCEAARGRAPKEGGLSVEGAAWWEGALWLGLRSPLVDGKALLLRLTGDPRVALAVDQVVPIDLGGAGVRDLLVVDGVLWILTGPADSTVVPHGLVRMTTPGSVPERVPLSLAAGSEGIALVDEELLVVTDGDGPPGSACKVDAGWSKHPAPP